MNDDDDENEDDWGTVIRGDVLPCKISAANLSRFSQCEILVFTVYECLCHCTSDIWLP